MLILRVPLTLVFGTLKKPKSRCKFADCSTRPSNVRGMRRERKYSKIQQNIAESIKTPLNCIKIQ
jgi:hypothetical protein